MDGTDAAEGCHNPQREVSWHRLRSVRTPGADGVVAELGTDIAPEQTTAVMPARRLRLLDAPSVSTENSHRVGAEHERIEGVIDRNALREAVAELSERDRQLLFDYFIKGHTQAEIAADHFASQMQVSRWITAALRRVRNLLE